MKKKSGVIRVHSIITNDEKEIFSILLPDGSYINKDPKSKTIDMDPVKKFKGYRIIFMDYMLDGTMFEDLFSYKFIGLKLINGIQVLSAMPYNEKKERKC